MPVQLLEIAPAIGTVLAAKWLYLSRTIATEKGHVTMAKVKDPVCGMEFDSSQAEAQESYHGRAYYFCSEECRQTFDDNPKEFIGTTPDQRSDLAPPSPS